MRNPGLARTHEPIARLGAKNFYRGLDVYSMGPPSSSGSTVGEPLNILEASAWARPTGRRRCTCIWRRRASLGQQWESGLSPY